MALHRPNLPAWPGKDVEALLRSWHFPNLDRVTFSEDDQDIVISGRPRGSHGKVVRAITRAGFNLALLQLCAREGRPFPGMLLIDSPLVVYREPDTDEGAFPHDVKDAFYIAVAASVATASQLTAWRDASAFQIGNPSRHHAVFAPTE